MLYSIQYLVLHFIACTDLLLRKWKTRLLQMVFLRQSLPSLSLSLLLPLYPLLWFFITLGYTLRALCIRRFELNTRGFMFMFVLNILQVFRLASVLLSPFLSHAFFFHFLLLLRSLRPLPRWITLLPIAAEYVYLRTRPSLGIEHNPTRSIFLKASQSAQNNCNVDAKKLNKSQRN